MFDDKPCLRCGKLAVIAPLCLACLLEIDLAEFTRYKMLETLKDEFPQDEGNECTMCGKPNVYGGTDGMCSSCRQIWNG